MAYSEDLAERVREVLGDGPTVAEKRMMGGLVFMLNDKMCAGIMGDSLMLRIAKEQHQILTSVPGCTDMVFKESSKPMLGYVVVSQDLLPNKTELLKWLQHAIDFNAEAKSSKRKKKKF